MKQIDDAQPFMRMMPFECGFRAVGVAYKWRARKHGLLRNRFAQLVDRALNGLVSFSNAPVRLALLTGFVIAALSFLYTVSVVVVTLFGVTNAAAGTLTVIVAILFLGGVQLLFLAVIGEYVIAIFNQVAGGRSCLSENGSTLSRDPEQLSERVARFLQTALGECRRKPSRHERRHPFDS